MFLDIKMFRVLKHVRYIKCPSAFYMTQQITKLYKSHGYRLKLRFFVKCKILFLKTQIKYSAQTSILLKSLGGVKRNFYAKNQNNLYLIYYISVPHCIVGASNVNHRFNAFYNTIDNLFPNQNGAGMCRNLIEVVNAFTVVFTTIHVIFIFI